LERGRTMVAVFSVASALVVGLVPSAPRHATPRPSSRPHFGDPLGVHGWRPIADRPAVGIHAGAFGAAALLGDHAAHADAGLSLYGSIPQLDPRSFQPVCPASDGVYRFSQSLVTSVVGADAVKEYSPLIAGGLLRVRLELCVVESFFYEAIIPFIKENGISWVLPLHETVETFLAGTIFAVATNFILIGSTKIVTVIFTYADFFLGLPFRAIGGIGWRALEDKALDEQPKDDEKRPWWKGKPPRVAPPLEEVFEANGGTNEGKAALAFWGSLLALGQLTGGIRRGVEVADLFVGRYLLLTTVGYVGLKFIHFKVYDPIPF